MIIQKYFYILLLFTSIANAQNVEDRKNIVSDYDIPKLKSFAKQLSTEYTKRKKQAVSYALQNNIEIVKVNENGGISVLERVLEDGTLFYTSTLNTSSALTINTNQLYAGGSRGLALDGTDINLYIWDGGSVRNTHQELIGRVDQLDTPNGVSSHATHVAGTMIASGVNNEVQGMAYRANLFAYDFLGDQSEIAAEILNGMLISNHSYGINPSSISESVFGAYIDITANVDLLTFEAPYYLPVIAAGNSRNVSVVQGGPFNPTKNGFDLISGMNLAKNIISVANVHEVSNYDDASSVTIYSKSSWGPSDDGRIKPDISAQGRQTISSTAQSDTSYGSLTGTSMAAPAVSGSIGLLHQHHKNINGNFLKAATMKALVLHSAREAGNAPGPDYKYGWGLMDSAAAADLITYNGFTSLIEENTLVNDEVYTMTVNAIYPDEPLTATVVWTDPPGAAQDPDDLDNSTPRLINDIDIRVINPNGTTQYLPWKLDLNNPDLPATKGDNIVDNIEKVEIDNAVGLYTIQISHKGTLQNLLQDYSLVISGIAVSNFAITTSEAYKEFCQNDPAFFDLNISSIPSFSNDIQLSTTGLPSSLSVSYSDDVINNEGNTTLTIENLDSILPGDYPFIVTASSGVESYSIPLELKIVQESIFDDIFINNSNTNLQDIITLLDWTPVAGATSYEVEISTTVDFDNLVYSIQTPNTQTEVIELEDNTTYFWRIRASNGCTLGDYNFNNFETKSIECLPLKFSLDSPIDIDNLSNPIAQSVVDVQSSNSSNQKFQDINVHLNITHTWISDLTILLTSPEGTTITLVDNICEGGQNIDVIFDEKGEPINCNTPPNNAITGVIKPEDSFIAFKDENLHGNWTLTVEDTNAQDDGVLNAFGVEICYEELLAVNSKDNLNNRSFSLYPNPALNYTTIKMDNKIVEEKKVELYDIRGKLLLMEILPSNNSIFTFDVSYLNAGVYFVKLTSNNTTWVKKFIHL